MRHHKGHGHGPRARGRRRASEGWEVSPPIARFIEPAALLSLRDGKSHGYELADDISELLGVPRVDYGNLYRLLRRMEHEGLVSSAWNAEIEGRSKRTYALAADGELLLEAWIGALDTTKDRIAAVITRYNEGN